MFSCEHASRGAARLPPGRILAVHAFLSARHAGHASEAFLEEPPMPLTTAELQRELRELISALDRRVPHMERAGEAVIARDAALLREQATRRLAELEELESSATRP
jgi:hypothetical protein